MSKEKHITRDCDCPKRRCFVPFSGNGRNICRLYELGQCPPQEERKKRGERSSPKPDYKPCFTVPELSIKNLTDWADF